MTPNLDAMREAGIDAAMVRAAATDAKPLPLPANPDRPSLEELVAMHDAGGSNAVIADHIGKTREWVTGALAMAGIYPRRGRFEPRAKQAERARRDATALRLRERGLTFREIGARLGLSEQTARDSVLRAERRETP